MISVGPASLDTSRMSAIAEEGDEKEENKKGMRELENITDKIKVRYRLPLLYVPIIFWVCPFSILDQIYICVR